MDNHVQLITYTDRLGGGGLRELQSLLEGPLDGLFGGVHILPFYSPIDGADTGFDPIDHRVVDPRIGGWDDIRSLSGMVELTADVIVNHTSADSREFRDYLERGDESEFASMFLTREKVFPSGPSEEDLASIYRPRPSAPFRKLTPAGVGERHFWTTFTEQQIDLDVRDPAAIAYLKSILELLAANGVTTVRLDAVGYAIKVAGTRCFMIDDTYNFIDRVTAWAHALGLKVLAEIHAHYLQQTRVSKHVDYVYDFALPPLILHTLFKNDARALKNWLTMSPRNAITVLDTHDGIGVMDVGPDRLDPTTSGLIPPAQIDAMVEKVHANSGGLSREASSPDVGNLDLYQVNCTYFDALGGNEHDYLLARLIQFFAPGTPQVYYVGLLAGGNDRALLEATGSGRDVNRAYYSLGDIETQLERPVVRHLLDLIRLRNACLAFGGSFELPESEDHVLRIERSLGDAQAELTIDFANREFKVDCTIDGQRRTTEQFADVGNIIE